MADSMFWMGYWVVRSLPRTRSLRKLSRVGSPRPGEWAARQGTCTWSARRRLLLEEGNALIAAMADSDHVATKQIAFLNRATLARMVIVVAMFALLLAGQTALVIAVLR